MPLRINSIWRYAVPGIGYGLCHMVTDANTRTVTTWSEPEKQATAARHNGGYSWHGDVKLFAAQFEPVRP